MKVRTIGTIIFSTIVLSGYAAANVAAYDPFAARSETRELPPNGRSARGVVGGGVFWYGGFSGGK